jgi:C1A family cysteine protease
MRSYYDFSQYNLKPSQNLAFSPAFIYNQIKSEPNNCEGGTSIPKALDLVKAQGLPRISDFPYSDTNCGRQPTQKIRELASQYKIVGWKAIRDIESVKGELYRGNPVVVGMAVSSSFDNLRGKNIYTDERSEPNGPHAMVITGYDDTAHSNDLRDQLIAIAAYKILRQLIKLEDYLTQPSNLFMYFKKFYYEKQKIYNFFHISIIKLRHKS